MAWTILTHNVSEWSTPREVPEILCFFSKTAQDLSGGVKTLDLPLAKADFAKMEWDFPLHLSMLKWSGKSHSKMNAID